MKTFHFTAHIEKDNDADIYIGIVPAIPGAHTQAASLDELHQKLEEVLLLCLAEMNEDEITSLPEFVGLQQLSVAI